MEDPSVATQRLMLLGTLTGALAHEYNNLMTPVLAYAQEALRGDDPRLLKRALEVGVPQMRRAVDISRKLLELAHDAQPRVEPLRVKDAVESAHLCTLRRFERDGIRLDVAVAPDLEIMADPLLMQQVLLNLMLNAHQALKAQAERADRSAPGWVRVSARSVDSMVLIDVADNGIGISSDDIRRRINPFLAGAADRQPQEWRQVGLGLHVCRLIAQAHGATIEALPLDGAGCTFRLRWPAAVTALSQ